MIMIIIFSTVPISLSQTTSERVSTTLTLQYIIDTWDIMGIFESYNNKLVLWLFKISSEKHLTWVFPIYATSYIHHTFWEILVTPYPF